MSDNIQIGPWAASYAGRGWRVVPLHTVSDGQCSCGRGGGCSERSRGKHPRLAAWQKAASSDEEVVAGWWEKWPEANVGIVLGESSGIIDLETDSEAGEDLILRLFDGEPPPTPMFKSGRGKHRLFRWRPDLPGGAQVPLNIGDQHLGDLKAGNDGKGSQSVFPPSRHWSGGRYEWLLSPDEVEVAELSDEVIARIHNWNGLDSVKDTKDRRPKEHWDRIAGGVTEGGRNDAAASWIGKLLQMMADPFNNDHVSTQWLAVQAWNCANKPPLDDRELKTTFESVLRRERNRRTDETYEREFSAVAKPRLDVGSEPKHRGWKVVIEDTKPRSFLLYSPLWTGTLNVSSSQLLSAGRIRAAALEQKDVWVPKSFDRLWEGTRESPALGRQLIETAVVVSAQPEQHRDRVIANLLLTKVRDAHALDEGEAPDPRGRPQRLPDGTVVFVYERIWGDMRFGPDNVTRQEMSAVLKMVGVTEVKFKGVRFKRLTGPQIETLERFSSGGVGAGE